MIKRIHISGYRSLRDLSLGLGNLAVVAGENGVGKSNVYRAMLLLKSLAEGRFSRRVAEEGGMESLLWAGATKKGERRRVSLLLEHERFTYEVVVGLVACTPGDPTFFKLDPEVKEEKLYLPQGAGRRLMASRKSTQLSLRSADGKMMQHEFPLLAGESLLSQVLDPERFPFVSLVREIFAGWRFFHEFDTSRTSLLRQPQVARWSPSLDDDGVNLASCLQTIRESGRGVELAEAMERVFPEAELLITQNEAGLAVALQRGDLKRPLLAGELSDGTLRFLCLLATLCSASQPVYLVLNEPEMSLNEEVYPALSELLAAAGRSQIMVVTHALALAECLREAKGVRPVDLVMKDGATIRKEHAGSKRVWTFDD